MFWVKEPKTLKSFSSFTNRLKSLWMDRVTRNLRNRKVINLETNDGRFRRSITLVLSVSMLCFPARWTPSRRLIKPCSRVSWFIYHVANHNAKIKGAWMCGGVGKQPNDQIKCNPRDSFMVIEWPCRWCSVKQSDKLFFDQRIIFRTSCNFYFSRKLDGVEKKMSIAFLLPASVEIVLIMP